MIDDQDELNAVAAKLSGIDRSEATQFVDLMIKHGLTSSSAVKAVLPPVAEAPKPDETGVGSDPKAEGVANADQIMGPHPETADQRKPK